MQRLRARQRCGAHPNTNLKTCASGASSSKYAANSRAAMRTISGEVSSASGVNSAPRFGSSSMSRVSALLYCATQKRVASGSRLTHAAYPAARAMRRKTFKTFTISLSIFSYPSFQVSSRFLGKLLSQELFALMQAPFDRAQRHAEKCGNALQRHFVQKPKLQHQSMIGWEAVQGCFQFLIENFVSQRRRQSCQLLYQHFVKSHPLCLEPTLTLADAARAMACDGCEPRRKFSRLFNRRQRFKCQQPRVLGDIFSMLASDDAPSHTRHRSPIPQHQLIKSLQVADNRRDDQDFIRRLSTVVRHVRGVRSPE